MTMPTDNPSLSNALNLVRAEFADKLVGLFQVEVDYTTVPGTNTELVSREDVTDWLEGVKIRAENGAV